jgi:hypothetical protein
MHRTVEAGARNLLEKAVSIIVAMIGDAPLAARHLDRRKIV